MRAERNCGVLIFYRAAVSKARSTKEKGKRWVVRITEIHVPRSPRCILTVWNGGPRHSTRHFVDRAGDLQKNHFHVTAIVLQLLLASLHQAITVLDWVVSLRTQSQRRKDGGKVSDDHPSALPDPPRCGGRVSILGITIGGAKPMSFGTLLAASRSAPAAALATSSLGTSPWVIRST
jgi:hypothetical protein